MSVPDRLECICNAGFGMNLSCPIHSVPVYNSPRPAGVSGTVEELHTKLDAQKRALDTWSEVVMQVLGSLESRMMEMQNSQVRWIEMYEKRLDALAESQGKLLAAIHEFEERERSRWTAVQKDFSNQCNAIIADIAVMRGQLDRQHKYIKPRKNSHRKAK